MRGKKEPFHTLLSVFHEDAPATGLAAAALFGTSGLFETQHNECRSGKIKPHFILSQISRKALARAADSVL
jgi:hypothetical protein